MKYFRRCARAYKTALKLGVRGITCLLTEALLEKFRNGASELPGRTRHSPRRIFAFLEMLCTFTFVCMSGLSARAGQITVGFKTISNAFCSFRRSQNKHHATYTAPEKPNFASEITRALSLRVVVHQSVCEDRRNSQILCCIFQAQLH